MPRTGERGGPQTRARILDVATRLFLEHGYDQVTVAQIARETGVSSVTVFNHFPRKEDLFLDRADDAADLLRAVIRERVPGIDVLTSLHQATTQLAVTHHPLSGLNDQSMSFFQTVAASPALIARAREIAADLQQILTAELDTDPTFTGDATLLAAFFLAGYSTVLIETARHRLTTETPPTALLDDHQTRLDRLFDALRGGLAPRP